MSSAAGNSDEMRDMESGSGSGDRYGAFLVNRFGESYLPSINGDTFSTTGSEAFYFNYFGDALRERDSLYVLGGTDGGLLIRYLLRQDLPEGSRYLFIELDDLIPLLEPVLPELPPAIRIVSGSSWLAAAREMGLSDYLYLNAVRPAKSLAVVDASIPDYLALWNHVVNDIYRLRMQTALETGNHAFTISGMRNVAENRLASTCLQECFLGQGCTAVLLAGGPSLNDSLPWIRRHRNQLLVIAVARIARQLLQEGIAPDIVAAIDPHEVSFQASNAMLELSPDTLFVNMYHVHPKLLGQWPGRHVYMGLPLPWQSRLTPAQVHFFPGITVSHQALGVAIEMGCARVILCGFDLCFSREGLTHAKGSLESRLGPFMDQTDYQVETNGGWMAETRIDFHTAIASLAQLAAHAASKGCELINPSAGSAKIPGVQYQPWEAMTFLTAESGPETWLQRLRAVLPEEDSAARVAWYKKVMQELEQVKRTVQEIRRLSAEALECNALLFGRRGKPPDFRHKKRMDRIEELFNTEYATFSLLVRRWGVLQFLALTRVDKDRDWTDDEVEETGARYYRIYKESADAVLNWLDETRKRLRSRLEEESKQPDFRLLCEQWRKDGQPGRYRVVLARRGWTLEDIPAAAQVLLRDMETLLQEQLHPVEDPYRQHVRKSSNPVMVRTKLQSLFQEKNRERLSALADGLCDSEMDNRDDTLRMIEGYLAELDGNVEDAITAFSGVTSVWFREQVLAHLASLHLRHGNHADALKVLGQLAEHSPARLPQYAAMLRIAGRNAEAVEVYRRYLVMAENDMVVILKLAHIEQECGNLNAARELYQRVLARDPKNSAAQRLLEELP